MPKDIKFALLGFGQIGKKHAKLLTNCPDATLTAVIENNTSLTTDTLGAPFFPSFEAFLSSSLEVDVVNVCTPNFLHAQHCLQALEQGYHVVCEKPMGLTKNECENVINLSLTKGKSVFVVMQNRYSATAQWLKDLVTSGTLGDIYMVQTNCFWNRDERYYQGSTWKGKAKEDGGVLFTQFSHFVDMLYWCFGEMKSFHSRFHNYSHKQLTEFEDSGTVSFDFASGGMGILNFSTSAWDKNMESSITVIAQNGSLKIGGQYMEKIEYCHIKNYNAPELHVKSVDHKNGTFVGNDAHHYLSIQNVVETLKGKSTISTNALEGMKVVEMIEMMYRN